ncbi:MAG: DNA polymerase III subunit alpha [Candidatus Eiseniibacteriota bacterium]
MSHAEFVHLRVHSAYSLSEGALKIDEIVALCRAQSMPAVAITDTGNLFGALEFASAASKAGIQPIVGCQLGVKREDGGNGGISNGRQPDPDALVLLVQSEAGYRNLLKLVSRSFLETDPGERPHVTLDDIAAHEEGLICLTAGPSGAVGRLLGEGQDPAAEAMLLRLHGLFPKRLYVEIMRHNVDAEHRIEGRLIDLAYKFDLPLVATNEAFFSDARMFEAHDALLCVAQGRVVGDRDRRRLNPEYRFKSAGEMRALFSDIPEAVANTLVVAQRCAYMPEWRKPILPPFQSASGRSEEEELRAQAAAGLEARLAVHVLTADMDEAARAAAAKPYRERLAYELDVIVKMGFAGYFLIVADFIQWAKEHNIPVGPGRGSGAGSVVAWSLTITDLDPLRWGLLFERFLNPERISMPDFDVDFCQDRRDEVLHYVQAKYGRDKVAQIITFGKLQARAVLRDVGRVMQMPYGQVDRICKLVPNNPANPVTLQQAIDGEPQLQEMRRQDPEVAGLMDRALKLEGLYRHASTHAAGVVIGDRPLDELIPLYRDPRSEMPVTQFNMKYVESAGLVKFDFLGLKTLTVLARARELLAKRGIDLDFSALPLDDPATYAMFGKGDTTGVFQLESQGMRDVLTRLKPDRFEDIIAVVALYRPGPMENIPSYISRKHGEEQVDFLYPSLEPILKETYGIIIYQEQVMQIAQTLSGYSLGGADVLRRAMGKKNKAEMEAQRQRFVEGAVERKVPKSKASAIFDLVDKFAGYGFNKSHAAAYALVAYQTGYLKANYPVEFFAASMTLDLSNTDKLNGFRQELDRIGVRVLAPDINASDAEFVVETDAEGKGAIRYALAALKNVGLPAMKALVAERGQNGRYGNLGDFARRVDTTVINKRQMESLVAAGAFDGLNRNRRQLFDGIDIVLRHAAASATERGSAQTNLFGGGGGDGPAETPDLALPGVPDWPPADRLRQEFEAIGFYLSAHPLDVYDDRLGRMGVKSFQAMRQELREGSAVRVKLAGAVLNKKERTSARGSRMAFVMMSDRSGAYEVTVFSEVLGSGRELIERALETGAPLLVTADARLEGDLLRLTAQGIQPLDEAAAAGMAGLRVYIADAHALDSLQHIVERQNRGRGRMNAVVVADDREIEIALPGQYALSPAVRAAIKAIPGIAHVEEM